MVTLKQVLQHHIHCHVEMCLVTLLPLLCLYPSGTREGHENRGRTGGKEDGESKGTGNVGVKRDDGRARVVGEERGDREGGG